MIKEHQALLADLKAAQQSLAKISAATGKQLYGIANPLKGIIRDVEARLASFADSAPVAPPVAPITGEAPAAPAPKSGKGGKAAQ
jgi:hypothetical protein